MKKKSLLMLVILMASIGIYCQKVSLDTVKIVATNAHNRLTDFKSEKALIAEVIPLSKEDESIGYIINFSDSTFVIISGDYAIIPYLGGCRNNAFSFDDAPPGLLFLLGKYEASIQYARSNNMKAEPETDEQWTSYISQTKALPVYKSAVSPLLSTKWHQIDSWNTECPYDEDEEEYCSAGCTPVALAQVLRYWACKVNPTGSRTYSTDYGDLTVNFGNSTYDWSGMGDTYAESDNRWLIYSVGVSLKANYGVGSTVVWNPSIVEDALEDYWGFKSSTTHRWKIWHLSTWEDDLIDNLDDGIPVQYNGGEVADLSGHSWVIDGYDEDGKFYCNWGWGGNCDDYYALGDFTPGTHNYDQVESAVFNAEPVRTVGIEEPNLSPQVVDPGVTTVDIAECDGATSYYWTSSNGTITSPTTSPSTTLNTTVNTEVCVRSFNTLCDIYSEWDCENFDVKLATPSWSDTKTPLCNNSSYTTRYDEVPYATSYYIEASGGFLVWNWDNYNWQTSTTTSYTYVIVKAPSSGSGDGTISVIAKRSGAVSSDEGVFDIWHGIPPKPTTYPAETGIFQMGLSETESFHVTYGPHADSYLWTINGSIMATSPTTNPFVYVEGVSLGYGGWTCKSINECGQSTAASGVVEVISAKGAQQLSISPNPASEEIFISILNKDGNTLTKSASVEMDNEDALFTIFNCTGSKVFTGILESENARVNVADWPAGIYFLVYNLEGETLQKSFIVEE